MIVEDPSWGFDEDGNETTPPRVPGRPDASYSIRSGSVNVRIAIGIVPDCALRYVEMSRPAANSVGAPRGTAFEIYDVFAGRGGLVVCHVNDGYPGRSRYAPALMIPPAWAGAVEPAMRFARDHAGVFSLNDAKSQEETIKLLKELLRAENPLLSIVAFRALSNNRAVDIDESCKLIAAAEGEKQGALALTFLRRRQDALHRNNRTKQDDLPPQIEQRLKALAAVAASAKEFSNIRGIALACLVQYLAPPGNDARWIAGRPLAQAIVGCAKRSKTLSAEDGQLSDALERAMNLK
jgi:hypothetical protein